VSEIPSVALYAHEATLTLMWACAWGSGRLTDGSAETGLSGKQLTGQDLVEHLRTGCKPEARWRCVLRPADLTWQRTNSFVDKVVQLGPPPPGAAAPAALPLLSSPVLWPVQSSMSGPEDAIYHA